MKLLSINTCIIYPHLIPTCIQAILESPEQCLTLCEIYDWFMSNL